MPFKSPLNRKQYNDLKAAQRVLHDQIAVVDKMESCGMPCEQFRGLMAQLDQDIRDFEQAFYTPVPKS